MIIKNEEDYDKYIYDIYLTKIKSKLLDLMQKTNSSYNVVKSTYLDLNIIMKIKMFVISIKLMRMYRRLNKSFNYVLNNLEEILPDILNEYNSLENFYNYIDLLGNRIKLQ